MKPLKDSKHHLIPQHGRELEGSNLPENIRMLSEKFHRSFHHVFANREPHNQIDYLLSFNASVLQAHVIKEVKAIMLDDYSYVYRN